MDPRVMEALREAGVPFRKDEPFSRHTSMGVGGPAAIMAFPRSATELRASLKVRRDFQVPHRILGAGTNLVVVDQGLDELVVKTARLRREDIGPDGVVRAEAGARLGGTVVNSCRAGWRGLEKAVGIPGSLGGAVVMNAGAYGFSISEVLQEVLVYDADGEPSAPPEGWGFRYRGSSIPEGSAVASLSLGLRPDDPERLADECRELRRQRRQAQPPGRSAGCVFKNPPGEPAGRIIDRLGLRGMRQGGAVVSPRHANFVVNDGEARSADVLALVEKIRETVRRETGVDLELEIQVWRGR